MLQRYLYTRFNVVTVYVNVATVYVTVAFPQATTDLVFMRKWRLFINPFLSTLLSIYPLILIWMGLCTMQHIYTQIAAYTVRNFN